MNTFYTRKGSRTVVTNEQDGIYRSRLYVNGQNLDNGLCRLRTVVVLEDVVPRARK